MYRTVCSHKQLCFNNFVGNIFYHVDSRNKSFSPFFVKAKYMTKTMLDAPIAINSKIFIEGLKQLNNIDRVLDVGCGYPDRLIELLHAYEARKCVGIESKPLTNLTFSEVQTVLVQKLERLSLTEFLYLVGDDCPKQRFHDAYKLLTVFAFGKKPCSFWELNDRLIYRHGQKVQDYILNQEKLDFNKRDKGNFGFDVIIVSKVLSHLEIDGKKNWIWVVEKLIDMLSYEGIIFFRLNSTDGDISSPMTHTFNEDKIKIILNKLTHVNMNKEPIIEKKASGQEFRIIEIIGKKK